MSSSPPSFAVSLLLEGRKCLVVGGGPVAARKVEGLLACRAQITVIAPQIQPSIRALGVTCEQRAYQLGEAASYQLVFAATGIAQIDHQVFLDGEKAGVFVNAADDPANCSFILPAIARFGPVGLAVSTDGHSPALASYLRDTLAAALPEDLELIARALAETRQRLIGAGQPTEGLAWRELIEQLLASPGATGPKDKDTRRQAMTAAFLEAARCSAPSTATQRKSESKRGRGGEEGRGE